jgi:hypothetical protein
MFTTRRYMELVEFEGNGKLLSRPAFLLLTPRRRSGNVP